MVSRLFAWFRYLFAPPHVEHRRAPELIPDVDVNAMRRALQPAESGRLTGTLGLPPVDAVEPTHDERRIMAIFEDAARSAALVCNQRREAIATSIALLTTETVAARLAGVARQTAGDLATLERDGRSQLHPEFERARRFARDLEDFRNDHRLVRHAWYPESLRWHVAIIAGVAFVETVANGALFARGAAGGLLGGVVQAALFAAMNVLTGCVAGRVIFTHLHHRSVVRRMFASAGAVAYTAIAVGLGLMVMHFRTAMSGQADDPMRAALTSLTITPFHIEDLGAVLLLGLSLGCAAIAVFEGYRLDESYPGYGRLQRAAEQAHRDYAGELASLSELAAAIRDRGLAQMAVLIRDAQLHGQQRQSLLSQGHAVAGRFQQHVRDLEIAMQQLIMEYRAANEQFRREPPPQYFSTTPVLPAIELSSFDPPSATAGPDLSQAIASAQDVVHRAYLETVGSCLTVPELMTGAYATQP